ncbi:MAG: hypothetical protein CMI36_12320 [Owenweeksia sp.]|nr:hypothetical protein [Owenweeksia sp.]MBF99769.1 hypothetical protein [Owenweeksia sp.]HBF20398.1 hypothetical protein [Cryomorphaceae bacterium]|tara:strand:- start:1506 stop:1961 length:456 start_codon:yes stop_codon:yes gene_type:complete
MINRDKQTELEKYRDLNLATLDYLSETLKIATSDFNSSQHYQKLKIEVNESFTKGRLSKLKQWFRDLTDMPRETEDLKFSDFIKERTGHEVNLHERFEKRISKILDQGKIKTENDYRDVMTKVDYLSQRESADQTLIDQMNSLLIGFERKK